MKRRQVRDVEATQQRQLHPIYMAVHHIELGCLLRYEELSLNLGDELGQAAAV